MNLARNAWVAFAALNISHYDVEPIFVRIEEGCPSYKVKLLREGWSRYPPTITLMHTFPIRDSVGAIIRIKQKRWNHRTRDWDIDRSTKVDKLV